MWKAIIDRYKRMRTEQYLCQSYRCSYAFVGMGQHSLTNLYPVLHYLGVPLRYVCVTSEKKVRMIERKYPNVKATTSLDAVLNDETIKGVFVAASPSAHFGLASRVIQAKKSLFIEKPPCRTRFELKALIDLQGRCGDPLVVVGLQKRYAPAVHVLRSRLSGEHLVSYDMHYLTGAYPEGDALLELFIHPLDLATHLFGPARVVAGRQVANSSYVLMLQHADVVGTLTLSTSHSWMEAEECLWVCTSKGTYRLLQLEELTFAPRQATFLGLPLEKMRPCRKRLEYLYARNGFTPIVDSNSLVSQGYFDEVRTFLQAVEGHRSAVLTPLSALLDTYSLLDEVACHI